MRRAASRRERRELDGAVCDGEGRCGAKQEILAPAAYHEIVQFVSCPCNANSDPVPVKHVKPLIDSVPPREHHELLYANGRSRPAGRFARHAAIERLCRLDLALGSSGPVGTIASLTPEKPKAKSRLSKVKHLWVLSAYIRS